MGTDPGNRRSSLIEKISAVVAIIGLPLALFGLFERFAKEPIIALVVALITAILASVLVVRSGWADIIEVIVAWLTLVVVILAGFVILPKTMTVEGIICDTAGNPVTSEEVVLFDRSSKRYETQTNAEGQYQFIDVSAGKYKVQVRDIEIGVEAKGVFVSMVQQDLIVPTISAAASPTSTPVPTPTPTTEPPTDTPVLPTDTPMPPTDTPTLTSTLKPDAVVVASVNLRSGPGTEYVIIGTLSPNQVLTVTGRNADATWLQVNTDQMQEGWVVNRSDLVDLNLSTEQIPIVQTPTPPTEEPPPSLSFQNFEPDNGTPWDDYFRNVWEMSCDFEYKRVYEGSRSICCDAHAGRAGAGDGGTVGIYPSSSDPIDLSRAANIYVWVYDTQGDNTVELKLCDVNGCSSGIWSDIVRGPGERASKNKWARIRWPLSAFTGVTIDTITSIEIYEWNDGLYCFDAVSWQ